MVFNFKIDEAVSRQFINDFNINTNALGFIICELFISRYNRILIKDDLQFINTVEYIHLNPVQTRLVDSPEDCTYSSFNAYTTNSKTLVNKEEVLLYFDDRDNFLHEHGVR